jgi:hypothetical protein
MADVTIFGPGSGSFELQAHGFEVEIVPEGGGTITPPPYPLAPDEEIPELASSLEGEESANSEPLSFLVTKTHIDLADYEELIALARKRGQMLELHLPQDE